ncbi:uncharacterized protein LOC144382630 isoform X2 [Halichoerus grypus]
MTRSSHHRTLPFFTQSISSNFCDHTLLMKGLQTGTSQYWRERERERKKEEKKKKKKKIEDRDKHTGPPPDSQRLHSSSREHLRMNPHPASAPGGFQPLPSIYRMGVYWAATIFWPL